MMVMMLIVLWSLRSLDEVHHSVPRKSLNIAAFRLFIGWKHLGYASWCNRNCVIVTVGWATGRASGL